MLPQAYLEWLLNKELGESLSTAMCGPQPKNTYICVYTYNIYYMHIYILYAHTSQESIVGSHLYSLLSICCWACKHVISSTVISSTVFISPLQIPLKVKTQFLVRPEKPIVLKIEPREGFLSGAWFYTLFFKEFASQNFREINFFCE